MRIPSLRPALLGALLLGLLPGGVPAAPPGGGGLAAELARLTEIGRRSTVRVVRPHLGPQAGEGHTRLIGSGVALGDGRVLTCSAVVGAADVVQVVTDSGDTLSAVVVGTDRRSNVAVLRVPGLDLPGLPVREDALVLPGTFVVAVGQVADGVPTSTFGSVVVDAGPSVGYSEIDMIRTTNPVFGGYTGGPLLDEEGRLVGLVSGTVQADPADLVLPPEMDLLAGYRHDGRLRTITPDATTVVLPAGPAVRVADELTERGFVERGYLGLQVELVERAAPSGASRRGGVLVHQLVAGGPAERAGLLPGDFILEFGGVEVNNADDLAFSVASRRPGTSARVRFLRRGTPLRVTVLLEQAPPLPWESRFDEALAGRLPASPAAASR